MSEGTVWPDAMAYTWYAQSVAFRRSSMVRLPARKLATTDLTYGESRRARARHPSLKATRGMSPR